MGQKPALKSHNLFRQASEAYVKLPNYYYVPFLLVAIWVFLYRLNVLQYLVAWYVFCMFFSPHASFEWIGYLLRRSLMPYKGFPLFFGSTGLSIILSRIFLIYPFETLLYYLDEILFFNYRNTKIEEPFIIVGQPRSGTTKFETLLEADEDLVCLKLYEIRWPYLTFQFALNAICYLDAQFLSGSIKWLFRELKLHHVYPENQERESMRRVHYDIPEEDDTIFMLHFLFHLIISSAYPDPDIIERFHHFDGLSKLERRRMMLFHKKAVQKVMYRRGQGKRYFAKWVVPWGGVLEEAFQVYPDLKLLVMVRKPEEQLRSWMKLQGLMGQELSTINFLLHSPECLATVKRLNVEFYNKEIQILENLDPSRYKLLNFSEFYKNIQKSTRECYAFLKRDIKPGSHFDRFLMEQTLEQQSHKATATDQKYITEAEIKQNYPDLTVVLFENTKKRLKAGQQISNTLSLN